MWDPEGLLSTLTPTANLLLGVLAGEWLRRTETRPAQGSKLFGMAAAGIVLMLAGIALNPLIPINKKIWTDSFMLFSGGVSVIALALLYWMIDRRRWRWGIAPALIFGSNAILAFVLATMLGPLERLFRYGEFRSIHALVYHVLVRWMSAYNASLGYAFLFVAANLAILWLFYRKRIFLRL
jgi:predicted acyltransferase